MTINSDSSGIFYATVCINGNYDSIPEKIYSNIFVNNVISSGGGTAVNTNNINISYNTLLNLEPNDVIDVRMRDSSGNGTLLVNNFSFILNKIANV
jgi:hypothetical protein